MTYEIETKLASKNAYFTPAESNAYYKARYSREGITGHWWGDGTGADNHDNIVNYFLAQAEAGIKSVNYVVSDKKITCMVDPDMVAWCSNGGNPTTVSIECQPTLGEEGYKRLGFLVAMLDKKYGHEMNMHRHSDWFNTTCCGVIDMGKARQVANGVDVGQIAVIPTTPAPSNPQITPASASSSGATSVTLPASVPSWRLYKEGTQLRPDTSDQKATLTPSVYGGITYNIVSWVGDYAVVVDTQMFGRGVLWVKDTEAQFSGVATHAATATPAPATGSRTLVLPRTVHSWRVYNTGGPWTPGHEIGFLRPDMFPDDLEYSILGNPGTNMYIINTETYGQVAIYAGPDTEAQFK